VLRDMDTLFFLPWTITCYYIFLKFTN
jgi:hypothetical protein